MLQLLICWKLITHTNDKKTNYSYCVGALRAFRCSPASLSSHWNKMPPYFWLPSLPSYHHQSYVLSCPSTLPVYPCLFSLPRGSLRLFRQDLSSSLKLQSAHHSAGCLERLTMTYQTLQTFNWSLHSTEPSAVIPCPQTPPLRSPSAYFHKATDFLLLTLIFISVCHGCLRLLWLPSSVCHCSSLLWVASHTAGRPVGQEVLRPLSEDGEEPRTKSQTDLVCVCAGSYRTTRADKHTHTHIQRKLQRGLC